MRVRYGAQVFILGITFTSPRIILEILLRIYKDGPVSHAGLASINSIIPDPISIHIRPIPVAIHIQVVVFNTNLGISVYGNAPLLEAVVVTEPLVGYGYIYSSRKGIGVISPSI